MPPTKRQNWGKRGGYRSGGSQGGPTKLGARMLLSHKLHKPLQVRLAPLKERKRGEREGGEERARRREGGGGGGLRSDRGVEGRLKPLEPRSANFQGKKLNGNKGKGSKKLIGFCTNTG